MFMRDAKQAEVLLSQQDNFLAKEETPVSSVLDTFFLLSPIKLTNYIPAAEVLAHKTFALRVMYSW